MFKIKFILYLIIALKAFSACNSSEEKELVAELTTIPNHFKTIEIDSLTTFSYPKGMLQVDHLKLNGDYQFADLINVQYAVVQIDLKETNDELDLKLFSNIKLSELQLKMVDPVSSKLEQFSLNNIKGYSTEIDAKVYGWPSKLHYWISIVELDDKYVTTITWTTDNRIKEFKEDAEMIVKSFRMKD